MLGVPFTGESPRNTNIGGAGEIVAEPSNLPVRANQLSLITAVKSAI